MRMAPGGEAQEQQGVRDGRQSSRGPVGARGIVPGCCVAVLEGRHFSAFGSGDEGVVISVDPEALNCRVQFEGRGPRPVPVALRHLRVLSAPEDAGSQLLAAQDAMEKRGEEPREPAGGGLEESLLEDGLPLPTAPAHGPSAVPTPKLAEPASGDDWLRRGWLSPGQLRRPLSRPVRAASLPPRSVGGVTASAPQLHAVPIPASASAVAASGPGMADIVLQSSQASRLEAVEARVRELEEEHRQEVASLRHALKECVTAINACSRVVNMMCVAASETSTEWERTATALHHATSLGTRVLDGVGQGGAVSSSAGASIPVECTVVPSGSRASLHGGSVALPPAALPLAEPVAEAAGPRRFRAAALQPQSPRGAAPQLPAPVQTQPSLGPGLVVHAQPALGPGLAAPGWQGPWAAPPSPTSGEHGPGPPQQLLPPAGLTLFGGLGPVQGRAQGGYSAFCPGV